MMIKVEAPYQLGCLSSRWSSENLCRVGFARDRHPGCAASRESPHPGHDEDDDDEDDGDENGDDQNILIRLSLAPCQNSLHLHRSSKPTRASRSLSVKGSGD